MNRQPLLSQSFSILNSFLLSVVILFFFDAVIMKSYLNEFFILAPFGSFIIIIFIPITICLYSGISGILVEFASDEAMVLTFHKFKQNAKEFWKICFLVALLPYSFHLLLFVFLRDNNVSIQTVAAYVNIISLYLLARGIIGKKYLQPLKLVRRKITVNIRQIAAIGALYAANLFFFYLPQWVKTGDYNLARGALFLSKYIHLLTFLYFSILFLSQNPEIKKKFSSQKEIFFINPSNGGVLMNIAFLFMRQYPPLFVVLKALTPKHYKIREFNRIIFRKRYYQGNKLVAITSQTVNSPEAYRIAKNFRKHGSKVILGGPHVTYLPDEALEYADSVVIGEAEGVWRDVIKDYENNSLKKIYFAPASDDDYRKVYQELLRSPPEVIKGFLETTRGCKYRCDFCTIPALSDGKVRTKPIGEVIGLIKKINRKYKHLVFIDNNIYANPAYAKKLFKALKPLKIKWSSACTIDIAKDTEALQLAKESGCSNVLLGYEIFEGSGEEHQGGKLAMSPKYAQLTKAVNKTGIRIRAGFIFGFDSDHFENIFRMWKFSSSLKVYSAGLALLTPLPGSRLYYQMLNENRLINLNWRRYGLLDLVFKHKRMNTFLFSRSFLPISILFLLTASRTGYALSSIILIALGAWWLGG